jgi:NAD binding domain of 6-phosphogluconate dehydrogenase
MSLKGMHFVGMGVSGGEEGARYGPSLMVGGKHEQYLQLEPIFTKCSAQVHYYYIPLHLLFFVFCLLFSISCFFFLTPFLSMVF